MKFYITLSMFTFFVLGCDPVCNKDLRLGETLSIPIDLQNYSEREREALFVWNINGTDTLVAPLKNVLPARSFTDNNAITDNTPNGYYSSDLHGSNLYFLLFSDDNNPIIVDSMTNIVVRKSQEQVDDPCYKDNPNVQIDEVSFIHGGKVKSKGELVLVNK